MASQRQVWQQSLHEGHAQWESYERDAMTAMQGVLESQ